MLPVGNELCKGFVKTSNSSGHTVLWLHYSADPAKDPATPAGKAWVEKEKSENSYSINPSKWRAEYELDFDAGIGDLVFPTFLDEKSRLLFDDVKLSDSFVFFGGLDWGMSRNKTAFVIVAEDPNGFFYSVFEHSWLKASPADVARDIKSHPLYDRLQYIACDPAIQSHVVWQANSSTTIAELLSSPEHVGDAALNKLIPSHGRFDGVFINLVRNMWVQDPPRWKVSTSCPELINELSNLSHPEHRGGNNAVEKIEDRNNHLWDATKYVFLSHPQAGRLIPTGPKVGTHGYLMEIEKLAEEVASEHGGSRDSAFVSLYGMSL
jgi:hypothetical protein